MSESLAEAAATLQKLEAEITAYLASPPPGHFYAPPVIDWHHNDYGQTEVQGLTKFLSQVAKERRIVDQVSESPHPPSNYSSNLVALQAVWDAFLHAPPPLVGIWSVMDRRAGPGATKVDVIARGGDEWVKVNTIKETRLLVEFREHDSYINSDYEDDEDEDEDPGMTNSLLTQARSLLAAAQSYVRPFGMDLPRLRYVLTRLQREGHADKRTGATIDLLRGMGIVVDFASEWGPAPPAPPVAPIIPANDIILDLSVLIALCCDSTHHPLPTNTTELESRFRLRNPDGTMVELRGACRDLRDQLACEMQQPLMTELKARLSPEAQFWVTQEVRDRLPGLVDVIGGQAERSRARALFQEGYDFWEGSRWKGDEGVLKNIRVRVIEDEEVVPEELSRFDRLVIDVCTAMIAATPNESPHECESPPLLPIPTAKPARAPRPVRPKPSASPLRPGTVFPAGSKLPSGHTLRTLIAGITRRATVLTNNRGAVLKVLREAGVTRGIPQDRDETVTARLWVVNPSSLAEWRRIEVEESIARVQDA